MPEMHFLVRWPDGDEMRCYSPSLVVRDFLEVGRSYPVAEFVDKSRTLFHIASERVRAKYGYACSAALDQLAKLEERAAGCDGGAPVTVLAFELPAGFEAPRG
ncbi:MAG TPA: MSMEG_0570 family nitrogen starvation response protein [Polyangia bacterium]|jgi:uncharacterized repeat protein (TIGR04042 family)|nr:MSMEG_0570 family nitrogen starvation response protein [Polyangia bacterium]